MNPKEKEEKGGRNEKARKLKVHKGTRHPDTTTSMVSPLLKF